MTRRYSLAVAAIAIGMLIAYLVIVRQISNARNDAAAINISGRQRMLSQRIALLLKKPDVNRSEIETLVTQMRLSQRALSVDDPVDSRLQNDTDQMVDDFLTTVETGISNHPDAAAAGQRAIELASGTVLLSNLDQTVTRYQQRSESRVDRFRQLEGWLLTAGLVMLSFEVIFVFRPMVNIAKRSLSELKTSNHELKEFAYRISHDLRAPVVSSLGIVAMTRDSVAEDQFDEVKPALSHLHRSLKRAERTIDDITALLHLKQSRWLPSKINLAQVIDSAVQACEDTEGAVDVDWRVDVRFGGDVLVAEPPLSMTLKNLFENAIKYRDRSADPWIRVTAMKNQDEVQIEVEDNGVGIPKQFEDRIFKMFERFHPSLASGTGLGLYLVSQNANSLSGSIQYRRGEFGSVFVLRFPLA